MLSVMHCFEICIEVLRSGCYFFRVNFLVEVGATQDITVFYCRPVVQLHPEHFNSI